MAIIPPLKISNRYAPEPSVLTALRSPRILTREVLAGLVAAGILIMVFMPRITKVVPAPLVAIVILTAITVLAAIAVPTVGDQGALPTSLPALFIPNVPFTLETLGIIAPYALAMALVGLLESLMTAKLVDDITDTHSHKTREAWGQGVSNMLSGIFGGMGGCAMIGQTMINVRASGARTRISTFLAGVFLLILVVGLGDVVAIISMAALVAVAITHNLAIGVIIGVIVAMVAFARRVAHFVTVERTVSDVSTDTGVIPTARYTVTGELFFASSNDLTTQFECTDDPDHVLIDMTAARVWDAPTVAALDAITVKYESRGKSVEFVGMNPASVTMHQRLAGTFGEGI